jgi:hypothetical protein
VKANPALQHYSADTLGKIAYYRAVLAEREQGSPPARQAEVIAKFDTLMEDQKTVDKLPAIEKQSVGREPGKADRVQQRDTSNDHSL